MMILYYNLKIVAYLNISLFQIDDISNAVPVSHANVFSYFVHNCDLL